MNILLIILMILAMSNVAQNTIHGVDTGSIVSFLIAGVNFVAFLLLLLVEPHKEKKTEVDGDGNTIESP